MRPSVGKHGLIRPVFASWIRRQSVPRLHSSGPIWPSPAGRLAGVRPGSPPTRPASPGVHRGLPTILMLVGGAGIVPSIAPGQATPAAPTSETVSLDTTDGVRLEAVYYPVAAKAGPTGSPAVPQAPPPVVILLHDLEGSHASVAALATGLQQRGIAVLAPDLRGHGGSTRRLGIGVGELDARSLRKADFEAMGQSRGGRIRQQATDRGDVEVACGWLKELADKGGVDLGRLFVVGSGLGATVAAGWTVNDAAWPDIASGPQGRQVRGIVLISPELSTKGFALLPLFKTETLRRTLPLMMIAGEGEKDAVKIFADLQKARPAEWYEQRAAETAATPNPRKTEGTSETLFFFELRTPARADALASASDVPGLVAGFINKVLHDAAAKK